MKRAVVDQPGLKIVLIGVVLSLFFGLILRSQIRPSVVKAKLQNTVNKLQQDASVDFESVDVRLSEWGIPRPVVEIKGIRISPLIKGCEENQIYIESLAFPITLNLLFLENKTISNLHLSLVELRIKKFGNCLGGQAAHNSENGSANNTSQTQLDENKATTITSVFKQKTLRSRSNLSELKIDRLRILPIEQMRTALDFNAVQMQFGYTEEGIFNQMAMTAQFLTFKDPVKNYYLLKSDVKMNLQKVNNFDGGFSFNIDFNGLILDRPFDFKIKNTNEGRIQIIGELNHISIKALNYIARIENPELDVYDFLTGSSISAHFTGEYDLAKKDLQLNIRKIVALVAGGVLEVNEIHLTNKERLQVTPFDVQMSQINLTKILSQKSFDALRPSIESAGTMSGLIQVRDFKDYKVKALIEKTAFVFSNKGKRIAQVFDSFNLHAWVSPEKTSLKVDDFTLNSEKISGNIQYVKHNDVLAQALVTVKLQGNILTEETVEIFTNFKQKPRIDLSFTTDLKQQLRGYMSFDRIKYQQVILDMVKIDYERDLQLKSEKYDIKSNATTIVYADDSNANVTNQFFDKNIFVKPSVKLLGTKMQLARDESGVFDFTLKAQNDLTIKGSYIKKNIDAHLSYKSAKSAERLNYKINGNFDQLNLEIGKDEVR